MWHKIQNLCAIQKHILHFSFSTVSHFILLSPSSTGKRKDYCEKPTHEGPVRDRLQKSSTVLLYILDLKICLCEFFLNLICELVLLGSFIPLNLQLGHPLRSPNPLGFCMLIAKSQIELLQQPVGFSIAMTMSP